MTFFKSYYGSVSSFLTLGNEDEEINKEEVIKEVKDEDVTVKESKSDGWLSGIYYDAYNSSGEMWRAVKTDLGEFASVISKDAKTVVVKTANGIKHGLVGDDKHVDDKVSDNSYFTTSKIKASINRVLEQVSKTLYIPPDSEDDDDFYYNNDNGSQTMCNRIDVRLSRLQSDRITFTTDPNSSELDTDLGDFNLWKEKLNMDDFQTTIAELVKQNKCLLDNFTELVPEQVAFELFWARYLYRVASAKAEESRREALKLRISHDEDVGNTNDGGDWDDGNNVTEETCNLSSTTVKKETENIMEKSDENPTRRNESSIVNSEYILKVTEKNDVIVVKHVDSSSASEDNNQPEQKEVGDYACWDDDDIDVDLTEEDLEFANKVTDKEVLEMSIKLTSSGPS